MTKKSLYVLQTLFCVWTTTQITTIDTAIQEHITHLRENGRMQYSYVTEANVYEIDYRFMIEKTESDDLYFNISGIVTKKTDGTEGPTFEETYFMQL